VITCRLQVEQRMDQLGKISTVHVKSLPRASALLVARSILPRILYPYNFGSIDMNEFVELLKDESNVEVRIREMPCPFRLRRYETGPATDSVDAPTDSGRHRR